MGGVLQESYLGGRDGPDFVVVRAHEKVGNANTHHADDPLVEVLGLSVSHASLESSIDHAINALDLLLLGQHGDVVLEGVGDPLTLAADVGNTLVGVPVVLLGESLINAVVEVLVVGENNVATDVVQLSGASQYGDSAVPSMVSRGNVWGSTYEAFRGHIGRSETTGSLVGVDNQPGRAVLRTNELVRFFALPLHQSFPPSPFFFSLSFSLSLSLPLPLPIRSIVLTI